MPASSHEQTLVSGNRRKLMPNDLSSLSRLERRDQPWTYPYWYIRCRISARYDDHPSCGNTDRLDQHNQHRLTSLSNRTALGPTCLPDILHHGDQCHKLPSPYGLSPSDTSCTALLSLQPLDQTDASDGKCCISLLNLYDRKCNQQYLLVAFQLTRRIQPEQSSNRKHVNRYHPDPAHCTASRGTRWYHKPLRTAWSTSGGCCRDRDRNQLGLVLPWSERSSYNPSRYQGS